MSKIITGIEYNDSREAAGTVTTAIRRTCEMEG